MDVEVTGDVWEWRGPAPHHFVWVPEEQSAAIESVSPAVTYGWGMIPVTGRIGKTAFTTSLWPKEGRYVVPIKAAVRRAERIELGDIITIRLTLDL